MKVEIKHLLLKSIQLKNAHDTVVLNNEVFVRQDQQAVFMRQYKSGKFLPCYENHFQPSEKK